MRFLKLRLLLLSLASGLILSLAWPERGFPGLLFIGLVPFLWMEDLISANRERFNRFSVFFYSYPGFFLWNLLTTWWIVNSTGQGAIMAVMFNAMFMSIVFLIFHGIKRRLNYRPAAYLALICFWIMLEYLHLNWDLNWPWLNLGNGFASYYRWVEWFEYTGTFGGTLWVLIANILIYNLFNVQYSTFNIRHSPQSLIPNPQSLIPASLLILLPIIFSYILYYTYKEKSNPVNVVIVQPNIDPYSEQYVLPPLRVVGRIMSLAGPVLDSSTNLLVAPESALQQEMWENNMETFESVELVRQVIAKYPNLNIIVGGSTYYAFRPGEKVPHTARKFTQENRWYNRYNAAIMVNRYPELQLYHKSKLTPGVEILPSFRKFKWLEKFAINLGGTVGSLGTDKIRKVFSTVRTVKVSPVICYESIFGEFFSEFVKNGAGLMFIITNDGWWGNTAGHRQHFAFASLRAIETRRSIARSANTGISAFINQRGDILQETPYWKQAVIKNTLNASSKLTFYVRQGDYIARIAMFPGFLLFLLSLLFHLTDRQKKGA